MTEYTVEIYTQSDEWIEQVDVFTTYEEACDYINDNPIDEDNYRYSIWFIEYDENCNEIDSGPIC